MRRTMKSSKLQSPAFESSLELLEEIALRTDASRDPSGSPHGLLVGEILDGPSPECPNRVLVRWRTAEGVLNERWLCTVKGLVWEKRDLALLEKPGNWPECLVTHIIANPAHPRASHEEVAQASGATTLNASADGKRIEIEGKDEVVLRCGEASITLRRNGRIVIRGAYVETRAKGTNRIKGGVVLIN